MSGSRSTRTTFDVGEAAARGARPFLVVCAFSLGAIGTLADLNGSPSANPASRLRVFGFKNSALVCNAIKNDGGEYNATAL
jgi:hypothetical protein